jgi:phage terminase large subunit-like protein
VLYPPLGYSLQEWQRKILRKLYGTVETATGLRQFRRGYFSVAKKNGKSFLVGGLPIYHLLMEDEWRPEAYGAAAAKEQAGIVFKAAAELVRVNPDLLSRLRIVESKKRIVKRDGNGFYVVLSADGDNADGIEPSLLITDEIHRFKTAKAMTLYDVTTKGMLSRREPLGVEISTAGEEYESPLWVETHEYARRVLEGIQRSDRFYPEIWSADEKRLQSEPDYWKSREARVAANPSHEDLGGFLRDEAIVEEMEKAIANPSKRPAYYRYHLNVGVASGQERAIDMDIWRERGGGADLRKWPGPGSIVDLQIQQWGLRDRRCFAGVDSSWTTDLTALSLLFPPTEADPVWRLLVFFWMPTERVMERERRDKVPYGEWVRKGFIEATPGNAVDQSAMLDKIHWAAETFDLQEVAYDPWNFRNAATGLVDEGFRCIEVRQGYASLSEPTKKLLELYLGETFAHGNNPVLNWNASCLTLQGDRKDNVQPSKPERSKSSKRIDGISATITAMAQALVAEPSFVSPNFSVIG